MTSANALPAMLIVEPQFVLRRAIVAVARSTGAAHFTEATNIDGAAAALRTQGFDALVMDVDSGTPAIELLERVRRGETACAAGVRLICIHSGAMPGRDDRLQSLSLHGVLRKPFKIGDLLASIRRS